MMKRLIKKDIINKALQQGLNHEKIEAFQVALDEAKNHLVNKNQ